MEILENNKRALKHVMPKFLEQRLAAAGVKNVFWRWRRMANGFLE